MTHGEAAVVYRTVAKWAELFRNGRESVEDDPRSGRSITEMTKANIEMIEQLIDNDPHITFDIMEEQTLLSRGTIERIIHECLGFRKVASRWVPHKLTTQNKQKRLDFAKAMLNKFNNNEWRLDQILTGDECWIYHRHLEIVTSCLEKTG